MIWYIIHKKMKFGGFTINAGDNILDKKKILVISEKRNGC